jgi:hypothetical protein
LDEFRGFSTVSREHAVAVLDLMKETVLSVRLLLDHEIIGAAR